MVSVKNVSRDIRPIPFTNADSGTKTSVRNAGPTPASGSDGDGGSGLGGVSATSLEPAPQGLAGLPAARPVDFEGSCLTGRPMGALSSYTHVINTSAHRVPYAHFDAKTTASSVTYENTFSSSSGSYSVSGSPQVEQAS